MTTVLPTLSRGLSRFALKYNFQSVDCAGIEVAAVLKEFGESYKRWSNADWLDAGVEMKDGDCDGAERLVPALYAFRPTERTRPLSRQGIPRTKYHQCS